MFGWLLCISNWAVFISYCQSKLEDLLLLTFDLKEPSIIYPEHSIKWVVGQTGHRITIYNIYNPFQIKFILMRSRLGKPAKYKRISESAEHAQIKDKIAVFLRQFSENHAVTEYPDSGHESDVFSITYRGITIVIEIIWSLQKDHIFSDFLIPSNSFANVKLLIINHEFFEEDNSEKFRRVKREYDKLRISEIRKGYIISEPFDSNLVMKGDMDEIKSFLDYAITILSTDDKIYDKHLADLKDHIVRPILSFLNENPHTPEGLTKIVNEELFHDYLRHFNLESMWQTIKENQQEIASDVKAVETEFRDYCSMHEIPTMNKIENIPLAEGVINIPTLLK